MLRVLWHALCIGVGEQFHFDDARAWKRCQFYEAVDALISTISWRLDEASLQPALTLEQLLTNATSASEIDADLLNNVIQYHPHLNSVELRSELILLYEHNISPSIPAIINWFKEVDIRRDTHKAVYAAAATLLVLPTTTASCERSFSGLRRLKTYLRTNMNQERLNSLIIATFHTNLLDTINVASVAHEFASLNDTRRKMYGSFTGHC
jgi:hAT family C-terminal dimerisation region